MTYDLFHMDGMTENTSCKSVSFWNISDDLHSQKQNTLTMPTLTTSVDPLCSGRNFGK